MQGPPHWGGGADRAGGDAVEGGAGRVDLGLGGAAGLGEGRGAAQQVEGLLDGAVVMVAVEDGGQPVGDGAALAEQVEGGARDAVLDWRLVAVMA